MTWAEFVEYVEDKLKEKKISRDTEIQYIDTSCCEVDVGYDEELKQIYIY